MLALYDVVALSGGVMAMEVNVDDSAVATMYGDHQAPRQDEASGVKKKGTLSKTVQDRQRIAASLFLFHCVQSALFLSDPGSTRCADLFFSFFSEIIVQYNFIFFFFFVGARCSLTEVGARCSLAEVGARCSLTEVGARCSLTFFFGCFLLALAAR